MCGIAGLFDIGSAFADTAQALATLREMTDSMIHRGPDAEGIWADPQGRCFLGHRRLSIIDTSDAGRQPMSSVDGRWVISFNGEIYNFLELRPQLEAEGMPIRGRTDTEVLLASIALWGIEGLSKLDGMFAFAAFDRESGDLILARDPFGEKPLYYMELAGRGLAFASELQALERIPHFDGEVNVDAMAEVLMFQYIGAPRTIYRHVKKLPPGHWLIARAGEPIRFGRYFEFQPGASGFDGRPLPELADELEDILVRSIKRRMIADVPLGAFLSGGVDSSTVCALVRRKLGVPLKTFSIGFEGAPESEHKTAEAFARHLGTEHYEQILAPNTSDFLRGIGRLLDEPNGDSSCLPTYLLSRFAREQVTVAISGDGGDEMFGGYGRYFSTLDEADEHACGRRPGWRAGTAYYSNRILVSTEENVRELFGFVPEGIAGHMANLREHLNQPISPLACLLRKTDVDNYMPGAVLPKVDRMSMQHSLEVRTPFLNVELARFAERLPRQLLYSGKHGKLLLRELAYRYLPRSLVDLPKQGFGMPMSRWGRDELLGVASRLLESEDSRLREALGPEAIGRFMKRQRSSGGFSTYQVWALAMLGSWARHHPVRLPRVEVMARLRGSNGQAEQGARQLVAVPLGGGLFVVVDSRGVSGRRSDAQALFSPEEYIHLTNQVAEIALRLGIKESALAKGASSALDWEPIPLPDQFSLANPALKGASLFLLDIENAHYLDTERLHALRKAGVASIVYRHPHRAPGNWVHLRLKASVGEWRDRWDLLKLRLQSLGAWRLGTARHIEGNRYDVGPISRLPDEPETELSHGFGLFEGPMQLAPIPVSHNDVARLGRGRYSIWSQSCVFSPYKRSQFGNRYWLVTRDTRTEALLPVVADIVEESQFDERSFFHSLGALADVEAGAHPLRLAPADRVVVVTHALWPGGAERQWCYLAAGLQELGYNVTFLVMNRLEGAAAHYLPYLKERGIDVRALASMSLCEALSVAPNCDAGAELTKPHGNPFGFRLLQLASLLTTLRPMVVFAQLDYTNLLAGTAALVVNVPRVVLSFRNYNPSNFSYLWNDWFQPAYQALCRSDSVLLSGNSHGANRDYAHWIGVPESRVVWIPNAIDPNDFPRPARAEVDTLRKELRLEANTPVILGVFRLSEEKRPLLFVETCAYVKQSIPQLRVLLVGIGALKENIRTHILSMGVADTITMLGRRNDVAALMSVADVLLLTSCFEGMPNVVMEAQLVGLPVVAARVGGVPDCVRDGETGLLIDSDDAEEFATTCVALLQDSNRRRRMGEEAATWMNGRFSRERMVQSLLDLAEDGPSLPPIPTESASRFRRVPI